MSFDVVSNGHVRPSWAIQAVDALLEKVATKPMWDVIDFLVKIYLDKHPEYATKSEGSHDLKNKFGASEDLGMRHLISCPVDLADMLKFFYEDEMTFAGKSFWIEFGTRYPVFAVPDKF